MTAAYHRRGPGTYRRLLQRRAPRRTTYLPRHHPDLVHLQKIPIVDDICSSFRASVSIPCTDFSRVLHDISSSFIDIDTIIIWTAAKTKRIRKSAIPDYDFENSCIIEKRRAIRIIVKCSIKSYSFCMYYTLLFSAFRRLSRKLYVCKVLRPQSHTLRYSCQ